MTLPDWFLELERRVAAVKHWHTVNPEIQTIPYSETEFPDMERLISLVCKAAEMAEFYSKREGNIYVASNESISGTVKHVELMGTYPGSSKAREFLEELKDAK